MSEIDERGLVDAVPAEVFLAYDKRAKEIASLYAPNAVPATKNAILKAMLEARLSGEEAARAGAA